MNKEHINGHAMYKIDFTYFVPGTGELYTLLMFKTRMVICFRLFITLLITRGGIKVLI